MTFIGSHCYPGVYEAYEMAREVDRVKKNSQKSFPLVKETLVSHYLRILFYWVLLYVLMRLRVYDSIKKEGTQGPRERRM